MKIEKLEPSRHRQGRWLVWLEDGSLVRLGEGEVVSLSLDVYKRQAHCRRKLRHPDGEKIR